MLCCLYLTVLDFEISVKKFNNSQNKKFHKRKLARLKLTILVTEISFCDSQPNGLDLLSLLSNIIVTVALVIPACPFLYTNSFKFVALTCKNKKTQMKKKYQKLFCLQNKIHRFSKMNLLGINQRFRVQNIQNPGYWIYHCHLGQ